ncbi:MAG: PAS domain S-box protein [Bacteroidetes bacterium]|nr:PAS domain S-box protein [Bacteroidota bacterium]
MNPEKHFIPENIQTNWQRMLNLLAKITNVAAALIMKVNNDEVEVFVASKTLGNPYKKGDREKLIKGLYCEKIIRERKPLLVFDASIDPEWDNNPHIKLGMVFFHGYPLMWPDGEIFGTVCVLDKKDNSKAANLKHFMYELPQILERDLAIIYNEELKKQAEKELYSSNEKFRSIFEGAGDGILYVDNNVKVLDVNPAFTKITGIPKEAVVGKSGTNLAKKFVNKKHLPHILDILNNILKNKPIAQYELYYQDKILEINSSKQESGHHVAIIRDITAKKRALEVIQESHIYNRSLFDTLPIGLALASMDGTLVDVNPAYAEIIGRTIDECKKLTYWDITPKAYDEQEQQQLESLNKTGKYGSYDKEYIHKNGHLVPVRLKGKIIEQNGTKYIWSCVKDITQRKKIEKDIQWKANIDEALATLYSPLISPSSTMMDIALKIKTLAQKLTDSTHCYVGTIDPEKGDLVSHTNTEMMENGQCAILLKEDKRIVFPMSKDGTYGRLWGYSLNTREAFFTNDVSKHFASKGIPEGHITIERFLSVPVMLEHELVGQIAIANPGRDYVDKDIISINRLGEFFAMSIRKQRFLDDLKTRSEELEVFNSSMLDREMRIIELKEEINKYCEELNKPVRFPAIWDQKNN